MADTITRIEVGLTTELDALVRAGRRNSTADEGRLRKLATLIEQAKQVVTDLGLLANDDDDADIKALPLDKLAGAVCDAVSRINRGGYDHKPYDEWCQAAAVYTDVVIVREGLGHWSVPYTVGEKRVELAPRDTWTEVEMAWTEKSASAEDSAAPAADLIGTVDAKHAPADSGTEVRESGPVYTAIKTVAPGRLRHYAVLWGSAEQRDLYHEWFTAKTSELDVIFKTIGKLPLLYHHGLDSAVKASVVGVVDQMGTDDVGLWVESQVDMANRYAVAITQMVANKKLGTSTGTLPGARRVNKSGEIERWAIVEVSLTPTPAEPHLVREHPVALVKAAYTALGLPVPAMATTDNGAEEARQHELELERERLALLTLSF